MTLSEFFVTWQEAAKELPLSFKKLDNNPGMIRDFSLKNLSCSCPIHVVYFYLKGKPSRTWDPWTVGKNLNLSENDVDLIVYAADNNDSGEQFNEETFRPVREALMAPVLAYFLQSVKG